MKRSEAEPQGLKLFLRFVVDIVKTVKGDPEKVREAANRIHPH